MSTNGKNQRRIHNSNTTDTTSTTSSNNPLIGHSHSLVISNCDPTGLCCDPTITRTNHGHDNDDNTTNSTPGIHALHESLGMSALHHQQQQQQQLHGLQQYHHTTIHSLIDTSNDDTRSSTSRSKSSSSSSSSFSNDNDYRFDECHLSSSHETLPHRYEYDSLDDSNNGTSNNSGRGTGEVEDKYHVHLESKMDDDDDSCSFDKTEHDSRIDRNKNMNTHNVDMLHNDHEDVEDLDELGISLLSEIFPDASREELQELHFQRVEVVAKSNHDAVASTVSRTTSSRSDHDDESIHESCIIHHDVHVNVNPDVNLDDENDCHDNNNNNENSQIETNKSRRDDLQTLQMAEEDSKIESSHGDNLHHYNYNESLSTDINRNEKDKSTNIAQSTDASCSTIHGSFTTTNTTATTVQLPLTSNLGRRIIQLSCIDPTLSKYSKLKDCLDDDFLRIPKPSSSSSSLQSSSVRHKSSSITSNTNTTRSYKEPTLHPSQITQFENNIQQSLLQQQHQLSFNPFHFQNHNLYKVSTTTLHRDMYVGLGLQLCERNGFIHVNALICPNGRKITTIDMYQRIHTYAQSQLKQKQKDDDDHNDDNLLLLQYYGPAFCAGIKPGDCLLGVNGKSFYESFTSSTPSSTMSNIHMVNVNTDDDKNTNTKKIQEDENNKQGAFVVSPSSSLSSSQLLANAAKIVATSNDPIAIHVLRMKDGAVFSNNVVHTFDFSIRSSPSSHPTSPTLNLNSSATSIKHHDDKIVGHESTRESHNGDKTDKSTTTTTITNNNSSNNTAWEIIDNRPSFSIRGPTSPKSPNIIHPFVTLLSKSQIIKPGHETRISETMALLTKRACLWQSNHYLKNLIADHYIDNSMSTSSSSSSFPRKRNHGVQVVRDFIKKRDVLYPGFMDFQQRQHQQQQIKMKQNQSTKLDEFDHSWSELSVVRQALCIHIVNTFVDEHRLAFTIWVYDVQSDCEWYAPVRYLQEFHDLRAAVSQLHRGVERLPFPTNVRWIQESEIVSSQSFKEARCTELEAFLRGLCTMVYWEDLIDSSSSSLVEIALYIQTFIGCDSQITSSNDTMIDDLTHCQNSNSVDIQRRSEQMLNRFVQLYTFRIFLLPEINFLVSQFKTGVKNNVMSFDNNKTVSRTSGVVEKQKILSELTRMNHFYSSITKLIYDGCLKDFELITKKASDISSIENKHVVYKNAIREQVEIHAYVPLRSLVSRLLVFGWRYDDKEIYFKKQVLKGKSQSFFKIKNHHQSPSQWKPAIEILTSGVGQSTLPCNKLQAIVSSGKEIGKLTKEVSSNNEPVGADDFLPIFIYCVVQAEIERPCALSVLLRSLCEETLLLGEIGYYLSSFEAALAFIHEIDLSSVT